MKTTLTNQELDDIHAKAATVANRESYMLSLTNRGHTRTILKERGREWAQTVLRRTLPRPVLSDRIFGLDYFPDLSCEEAHVLILADRAEWSRMVEVNDEN